MAYIIFRYMLNSRGGRKRGNLKNCVELKRVCLQFVLDLSIQGISVELHQPDHDSAGPNAHRKSMNPKLLHDFSPHR